MGRERQGERVSLPDIPRRSVVAFAVLLLALSWVQFVFVAADARGWALTPLIENAVLLVAGFLSPLWAVLLVGGVVLRRRGLGRLLRGSVRFASGSMPYLLAGGGVLAAVLLASVLTPGLDMPGSEHGLSLGLVLAVIVGGLVANFLEQLAWRGWMQRGLQPVLGMVAANVVVGVVWALWHLPLFFIEGTPQSDAELSFVAFLPLLVALSVLLGAVYNGSDGSVLPATVGHTAFNASISVMLLSASGTQADTLLVILTGVFAAAAVVVALRDKRRTAVSPPRQ